MHKRFRGRHKFVDDIDGMEYYSEDKRITWDGLVVHKDNFYTRHPQEMITAVLEDTSVPDARPPPPDIFVPQNEYTGPGTLGGPIPSPTNLPGPLEIE